MSREFGQRLATEFLAEEVTLTHVLDTSGAYIPGHGTPTALLIGRNRRPDMSEPLVVVLAERAEPMRPPVPRESQVWQSIRRHARTAGLADRWTQSVSLDRRFLREFPWQLTDNTARSLIARMSRQSVLVLYRAAERPWYDWTQIAARAGGDGPAITFSWVASHNYFALQRGRVIALQSAPVIELPEDSTPGPFRSR